jgi:hypothetical protein
MRIELIVVAAGLVGCAHLEPRPVLVPWPPGPHPEVSGANWRVLDAELQRRLHRYERGAPESGGEDLSFEDPLRVTVEVQGEFVPSTFAHAGFSQSSVITNRSKGYSIITGTVPLAGLAELSNLAGMKFIEAPVPLGPAQDVPE